MILRLLPLLLLFIASNLVAQEDGDDAGKADFRLRCDFIQLRQSSLFDGTDLETQFGEIVMSVLGGESGTREYHSYDLAIDLRNSKQLIDAFVQLQGQPEDFELDFYSRLTAERETIEQFYEDMRVGSEVHEKDGQEYLTPVGGPSDMIAQIRNGNTFEVLSKGWANQRDQDLLSEDLKALLESLPESAPIKLACCGEDWKGLLRELEEMGGVINEAAIVLDVLQEIKSASLYFDPDLDEMLVFHAVADDEKGAEKIRGAIDGLLGILKLTYNNSREQMEVPEQFRGLERVYSDIINDLEMRGEGQDAILVVRKPESYAKAIKVLKFFAKKNEGLARITNRQKNNMRVTLLAMHNYESAMRRLPFELDESLDNELSWRVSLLPFMEQQALYNTLDTDKSWDDEANAQLKNIEVQEFGNGNTAFVFVRSDEVPASLNDIRDGTSNTICLVQMPGISEAAWYQSQGMSPENILKKFDELPRGQKFLVGMYDGSVRVLDKSLPREMLAAMLTHNGGEIIE